MWRMACEIELIVHDPKEYNRRLWPKHAATVGAVATNYGLESLVLRRRISVSTILRIIDMISLNTCRGATTESLRNWSAE